ncbi:MAG: sigma-54-dependent transcriptional regulator [Planctomycetota bacterium]
MIRVLLVCAAGPGLEDLTACLEVTDIELHTCTSVDDAMHGAPPFDVVLADLALGLDSLRRLKERDPVLPVLIIAAGWRIREAVDAMRAGALDVLTWPVEPEVVLERVRKAAERGRIERERDRLREAHAIVAESPQMREVLSLLEQVAATDTTVLLLGESGTGKELAATALHRQSGRSTAPLVKVNCAAVPASLFEAEFFGNVKGAYTGAETERPGHFAEANGGTLFLDEVGTLSAEGQAKLLHTLETGEVRPVGATDTRRVDVRVVAATNVPLERLREGGRFRSDLYYRLAVFPVQLPPLRERPEDLVALTRRFAAPLQVTEDAMRVLRRHNWPGNARELRNVIDRARILAGSASLGAPDLEPLLPAASDDLNLKVRVRSFERELFREALRRAGGRKADAARLLGIDPSNWSYHAKRLKLQPRTARPPG